MRKVLAAVAVLALAGITSIGLSSVAGAQYADVCTVTVAPPTVAPGDAVTLSGNLSQDAGGTLGGQTVTFSINDIEFASTDTDDSGGYSTEANVPVDLPAGTYTITADCGTGPGGAVAAETDVNVADNNANNPSSNNNNDDNNDDGGVGYDGPGNDDGSNGSGSNRSGSLARTGTDLGLPVQIGVALLALGGVALALASSRRRHAA